MSNLILKLAILLFISAAPISAEEKSTPPPPIESPEHYLKHMENAPNPGGGNFFQDFIQMLFVLGLLIGFLFLLMWFFKRMMNARMVQQNVQSNIKIVERRSLTTKSHIYILEVFDRCIVIADSVNGVTRLAEIPIEEEEKNG